MADFTGAVLADRFELKEQIGEGGYGAIYRAIQLSVDRACAVKILSPELCGGRTEERFRVEARMTSRLTHPNTVVVYDFGRDESTGWLFLAMELLEGKSVKDTVEGHGSMTVRETAKIVGQAAGSLQEAHEEGAAHRDVSPHNLMLVDRGGQERFVKVIDFGIAKALRTDMTLKQSLTQTGMMIGKPAYMAPEQIRSDAIDGRADQYGLAVTAYYMLAGRTPFGEGTSMEIASRQLTERPVAPTAHRSDLAMPKEAESALMKALEKEPGDRFSTIAAFGEALEAAVDGETSVAVPETPRRPESEAGSTPEPADGTEGSDQGETAAEATSTRAVPREAWPDEAGEARDDAGESRRVRTDLAEQTTVPVDSGSGEGGDAGDRRQLAWVGLLAVVALAAGGFGAWRISGGGGGDRAGAAGVRPNPAVSADRGRPAGRRRGTAVHRTAGSSPERDAGTDTGASGASEISPTQKPFEGAGAGRREENAEKEESGPEPTKTAETPGSGKGRERREAQRPNAVSTSGAEKAAADERREPKTPATVQIRMIPWGMLVIDGREFQRGSQFETDLTPGTHRLQMKQRDEVVVERTVRVRAGERKSIELVAP